MKIRLIDDVDEAKEIHTLAFGEDLWVGDTHTFWALYDGARVVGFCSAKYHEDLGNVYLSRSAVIKSRQGSGLQRYMINARLLWGMEQGARRAVTYIILKNYSSMINLLECGFRFYTPKNPSPWAGNNVHYLRKVL